jgi:hypothetical protein
MLNLIGRRFGRLIVRCASGRKRGYILWECACDCGKTTNVATSELTCGKTKSCGCLVTDSCREVGRKYKPHLTHGFGLRNNQGPEYRAYKNARTRCSNDKLKGWPNYGGRGIKFLFPDFPSFLAALGPRPSRLHSVDRIDNDGHYGPGNVRWATRTEQVNNRRVTRGAA